MIGNAVIGLIPSRPQWKDPEERTLEAVQDAIDEGMKRWLIPPTSSDTDPWTTPMTNDEDLWHEVAFEDIQVGDFIRHMWDQHGVLHTREGFADTIKHNSTIVLNDRYVVIASKARAGSSYYRLAKRRTPKES